MGAGAPKNEVEALNWFAITAFSGSETAVGNVAILRKRMSISQIAEAQRLAAQWR